MEEPMKELSKIISHKTAVFIMTICLIYVTMPAFALHVYAASPEPAAELTVNGSTTQYDSFEAALKAASGDATITLLKDATYYPVSLRIGADDSIH